jgi:polyisoprenoid-binding protein YceI
MDLEPVLVLAILAVLGIATLAVAARQGPPKNVGHAMSLGRELLLRRGVLPRVVSALTLAGLLSPVAAAAEARRYVIDPDKSQIRFHATSRFMDADGRFGRVGGEVTVDDARPESAAGEVDVDVASIDTGIGLRDRHLRSDDFFDVARYPRATFVLAGVRREGEGFVATGDLTIRGVTRRLSVPVRVTLGPAAVRVTGELTLDRRQFGVAYQSRLNPVGDRVAVSFDLQATAR